MAFTGNAVQHGGALAGGAATGSLGFALKEEFDDEVVSQFNNETTLSQLLLDGTDEMEWTGEYYVQPLHTGRNMAASPGAETHDYPDAGNQAGAQLQIPVAFYRTSGQITSKAILAAEKGNAGSVVDGLDSDIRMGLRDLIRTCNGDFYGSQLGIIAEVSALPGGNQLTLRSTLGAVARHWQTNGARFFAGGRSQQVVIAALAEATASYSAVRGRSTVLPRDNRTQITMTAGLPAGTAVGDVLIRAPSSNANDTWTNVQDEARLAVCGLEQIIDDGTTMPARLDASYFTQDRSTQDILNGLVRNMAGAAIDEPTLQDFCDAIAEQGGESTKDSLLLMHRSVRSRMMQIWTPERRFAPQEFKGGLDGKMLVYNAGDGDQKVYVDKDATYGTIFFVNPRFLKRLVLAPAHLVTHTGSALRQPGNAPVWTWNIEAYFQLFSAKANTLGKLFNVAADATYGLGATYNPAF